jgi:hypothetical protein
MPERAFLHASYLYNFKAARRTGFSEIKKHPTLYEAVLMDIGLVVHVTSLKQSCDSAYSLCVTLTISNSVALVRERTIPIERSPFVGEVSANFCG